MQSSNTLHQALTFGGFFLAGLAVNLTPCVYPMLTVTASLFKPRPHQNEDLRHSFAKAFIYFLGITITYSALGYFAASTGKIFGSYLQNSWVLGGVGFMMFALSLSMFGVFKLHTPSWLLTHLHGYRKANYLGFFFSGMFVGVFAAPCIGPPVLALLAAVAENGSAGFGLAAFFTFSCGLGLPYLLIGTFEKFVTQLPKAGNWLKWVERVFGVILLGFAVFYFSLAFHGKAPAKAADKIWQPYTQALLQEKIKTHKGVILDFYAEWCVSCHELDQLIFSKPQIKAKLAQINALRVDATNIDAPQNQALLDKYNIIGLPTVIFLDSDGNEIKTARIEGVPSLKDFNSSMAMFAQMTHAQFKE